MKTSMTPRATVARRRTWGSPRGGFTLVETAIAAMISSILLMSMAGIWQSFGRSVSTCVAESRLSNDSRLLLETLRQDFAGTLQEAPTGLVGEGRLVGRLVVGSELRLCYDVSPLNGVADWMTPDHVVIYSLTNSQLTRTLDSGEPFVVADHVTRFEPTRNVNTTRVEIDLESRGSTRALIVIGQDE